MTITRTSTPTPAVSLDEAKRFFRILHDDEDADIERMIAVAQERAVEITNRDLVVATYQVRLDNWSSVLLPQSPFQTVIAATYKATDGSTKAIQPEVSIDSHDRATLSFVRPLDATDNITIDYRVGYDPTPEVVKHYILTEALTLFETRENVMIGVSVSTETEKRHRRLLDSVRVVPV